MKLRAIKREPIAMVTSWLGLKAIPPMIHNTNDMKNMPPT
jgi:hypothetical protein